jgi:hypothetical protein
MKLLWFPAQRQLSKYEEMVVKTATRRRRREEDDKL